VRVSVAEGAFPRAGALPRSSRGAKRVRGGILAVPMALLATPCPSAATPAPRVRAGKPLLPLR